jgi:hypothetical protein
MGRSDDGNGSSMLIIVDVAVVAASGLGCGGHDGIMRGS